jgi:NDP-sugar pyrophosphorylase family protein
MIRQYVADADVDFDANCSDVVNGTSSCFNGDIISSLDVNPVLDLYKKNRGIGTLALS